LRRTLRKLPAPEPISDSSMCFLFFLSSDLKISYSLPEKAQALFFSIILFLTGKDLLGKAKKERERE
jgi:hypothetical protein